MFFPEVNKGIIVVKSYPLLVSVLLMPPEKGKNGQKLCWHSSQVLRKFTYILKALFEPTSLYFLHI